MAENNKKPQFDYSKKKRVNLPGEDRGYDYKEC